MNITQLIEVYKVYTQDNFKFADFDVAGLFKSVVPKQLHMIDKEEIQEVKDFLHLDDVETEDELRAIRNTIVDYAYNECKVLRASNDTLAKQWKEKNPDGNFEDFMKQNPYDIMWDQMSAFTHVIDMELYKRFGHD